MSNALPFCTAVHSSPQQCVWDVRLAGRSLPAHTVLAAQELEASPAIQAIICERLILFAQAPDCPPTVGVAIGAPRRAACCISLPCCIRRDSDTVWLQLTQTVSLGASSSVLVATMQPERRCESLFRLHPWRDHWVLWEQTDAMEFQVCGKPIPMHGKTHIKGP